MLLRLMALSAIVVVWGRAQEPATPPGVGYKDSFQLNVFADFTSGSSVELTNAGFHRITASDRGFICVNAYVFTPQEELCNCCTCVISHNSYTQLQLSPLARCPVTVPGTISRPGFTPLASGTVKLVATTPGSPNATNCNPSQLQAGTLLGGTGPTYMGAAFATGLRAWATTLGSKTRFETVPLSPLERDSLNSLCGNLQQNFPGQVGGRCPSCP